MSHRAFAESPPLSLNTVRHGVVARRDPGPLTVRQLVTTDGNRWSGPGEPTIYLGSDTAVALAEFARHLDGDASPPVGVLWTVDVQLDRVLDLRTPKAHPELRGTDSAGWALDRERCRSLVAALRHEGFQGLMVPSVAFLDQPEHWNLVVFVEAIASVDKAICSPRVIAAIGAAAAVGL